MSRWLDSMIDDWARDLVYDLQSRSGYSGINVVERLLKDPGKSTRSIGHVVLWWPRTKRLARMNRAMHQIDKISQICLIVDIGCVDHPTEYKDEDAKRKRVYTKHDLADDSSLSVGDIRRRISCAKRELKQVLRRDEKSA